MSRGAGRLERAILDDIARTGFNGEALPAHTSSWLAYSYFQPPDYRTGANRDWQVSRTQLQSMTRAMHSFVRKYPQYALMGGQGRARLWLYEPADPLSTAWAQLAAKSKNFVSLGEARKWLAERAAKR